MDKVIIVSYNHGWLFEDCGKIDEDRSSWRFECQLISLLKKWMPDYQPIVGADNSIKYAQVSAPDSDVEDQVWTAMNRIIENCDWIVER